MRITGEHHPTPRLDGDDDGDDVRIDKLVATADD